MSKKNKLTKKSKIKPIKEKNAQSQSISVCMIVKDEENFLENCLKSIKNIADEIIIVDTGSTDSTVEIAKRFTNNVYFHAWEDSFSKARNKSLNYATCDWIFQIDADEELVQEDIPVLFKAVKNTKIDAIMVQIVSHIKNAQSQSRHNVERIFRNNRVIRYEGRVHNRLVGFKKPQIFPIHLIHYGYDLDDKDLSEKKHQRRISLLKMDIEEQPENPLPYHYLSCCYLQSGQLNETLDTALKAIELAERINNINPVFLWTRYNAAMAYYKLNNLKNAKDVALAAVAIDDRHLDSYYVLTLVNFDQLKWDNVIRYGNSYLHISNRIRKRSSEFGTIVLNSINEAWNILVLLGIAYYETGRFNDSTNAFKSAVSATPDPFSVLRAIGIFYYNKNIFTQAREFLQKAFSINKEDKTVKDLLNKIEPDNKAGETISCCMIVKNEEEYLEKCLTSVKDYVDELIIVDTGSTDNTIEIAKRYTDKVYFHPWEDSFSKARNQALQYATGNWIFQIDGDEELMAGSGARMRSAIMDSEDSDTIYVKIYSSYARGTKKSFHNFERIFRNNKSIHYESAVHNQLIGGTSAFYSSVELWHYGYDVNEKKAQEKFERTTGLLKKEIEKNPDNPMHHHNLSASYLSRGLNRDASDEAIKAINLAESQQNNHDIYIWSHFIASMAFFRMGNPEKAKEYSLKSLMKFPEHIDSYYILTIISASEGRWDEVIRYGRIFLELVEHININHKGRLVLENTINESSRINILIGHAFYSKNLFQEMEACYKRAYETTDIKWRTWLDIGIYHMDKSGDLNLANRFFELAVKVAPNEHDAWYMSAKLNSIRGLLNDEIECLEKVIIIGTTDPIIFKRLLSLYIVESAPNKAMNLIQNHGDKLEATSDILCRIADLQIEKGQIESAVKSYMMALEKDPDLFEAWAGLGEIMLTINKTTDSKTFFEKALSIKNNDVGTILSLCDIASQEGEIPLIVKYCDLLLKSLGLPQNRTLNSLDDLKSLLAEINSRLRDNKFYQNQISTVLDRISCMQDQHSQYPPEDRNSSIHTQIQ